MAVAEHESMQPVGAVPDLPVPVEVARIFYPVRPAIVILGLGLTAQIPPLQVRLLHRHGGATIVLVADAILEDVVTIVFENRL